MAAVPKQKRSKSAMKHKIWVGHKARTAMMTPIKCTNCGEPVFPHRACRYCGMYKGRVVIETKAKVKRVSPST
jgi:large subunit ribosomal protein L32